MGMHTLTFGVLYFKKQLAAGAEVKLDRQRQRIGKPNFNVRGVTGDDRVGVDGYVYSESVRNSIQFGRGDRSVATEQAKDCKECDGCEG